MKKTPFFIVFFLMAAYSFAAELPGRSIFITGTAEQSAHRTFFMTSFIAEALAMDLHISDCSCEAKFTFTFHVQRHADEYDPSINYIILISLVDNETQAEIVSFGWPFAELEDMYEHNRFVFYTAAALIPGLIIAEEVEPVVVLVPVRDDRWQNQRFFIRASIDYPIAFYVLQPTGLRGGGQSLIGPDPDHGPLFQRLDHLIMPRPGLTVGLEWLFHNRWSIEGVFQGNFGDLSTLTFFNMGLGVRLMHVFRTTNFMIQPYGAFAMPLTVSSDFIEFPPYAAGGGIQIGVRGPGNGVFFIDSNLMVTLGEVYRRNPYVPTTPYPRRIHYRHFVFGLGIGYKFPPFGQR